MAAKLSGGIFQQLGVDEFLSLLASFTPARRMTAVHLHHTWKPRHRDYRGAETVRGMWRFHTQTQGWQDIAQHVTVAPDGTVWTGRHWDLPPASAAGHNGTSHAGPFMIEMIGNFDVGEDPFDGAQKATAVTVLAALLHRFGLATEAIRFHNEMSGKSCPGTSFDRARLLGEVATRRGQLVERRTEETAPSPFDAEADALFQALAFLRGTDTLGRADVVDERWDAEPLEHEVVDAALRHATAVLDAAANARDDVPAEFTPEIKEALRPYLVNLTRGRLSTTGEFTTSLADVELMFSTHLPKALAAAQAAGRRLPIVVYAHGGLNDERDGLAVAAKHVHWWVRNGAYPIYFAWETGLLSSILNVIRSGLGVSRTAGARDVFDFTDAQIEAAARRFGANRFWSDMKHIADLAVEQRGGARLVAEKLAAFVLSHPADVELHAIGHSAGSNFHSRFLPVLLDAGAPQVKTVQFLAPAITVDDFLDTVMRRLRNIGALTMFTMKDSFERADQTGGLYRKSLLYLIHEALESHEEVPILGLEKSVLHDIRLKRLFGIGGRVTSRDDNVVWSTTDESDLAAASKSVRHGGFDDDPLTMNSALRRVLGLRGTDPVRDPFVAPAIRADVDVSIDTITRDGSSRVVSPVLVTPMDDRRSASGRRRALCVGINAYRRAPLNGCVADARRWAATLQGLGFEPPRLLVDGEATRERILRELASLIAGAQPGDVLVFQYAGHGTTVPDLDGDEASGDSPADDEALCPVDFDDGRLIIDDDLGAVLRTVPAGVRLTSFIDACHSGSVSRLGVGGPRGRAAADERPRFIVADENLIQAHFAFRATAGLSARGVAAFARDTSDGDTLFAACRSTEVAWESNGQGDFTRAATQVLARGVSGLTHSAFLAQVLAGLGASPRQHPEIHPSGAGALGLLVADPGRATEATASAVTLESAQSGAQAQDVAALLRSIAAVLTTR
jgi:hypothetical protein